MLLRNRQKSKGFTLIKLLVAVGVFFILFLIILAFVRLAVGQTATLHTKMLTADLRNTLDTLSVQINNANGKIEVSDSINPVVIYGFRIFTDNSRTPQQGNQILAMASNFDRCLFVAFDKSSGQIVIKRAIVAGAGASCSKANVPQISTMTNSFTSPGIEVTDFILDYSQMTSNSQNNVPYLKITI